MAYIQKAGLLLISTAWATSAVVLAVGTGCAICAASDLYGRESGTPWTCSHPAGLSY
jgi:hypothetical protein